MAQTRLNVALETLSKRNERPARPATVAELCRLAEVSRNSLYRYHPTILQALRKQYPRGPKSAQARARKIADQRRVEHISLREDISKLAALIDHYYAAFRETAALLERRDRQLAELRRKLQLKPALLGKL